MNLIQKTVLLLCLTAVIGACAQSVTNAPKSRISNTREVSEKNYTIGTQRTAFVGDSLVRVKEYEVTELEKPVVEASEDFVLEGVFPSSGSRGDRYDIAGETIYKGVSYSAVKIGNLFHLIDENGTPSAHAMNPTGLNSGIVMVYDWTPKPATVRFNNVTDTKVSETAKGGYQNYEILFNGVNDNSVNLTYREYTADNLARAAYTQNLTYPRNTRTIRYKKTVISVSSISPEQIVYTVTQD